MPNITVKDYELLRKLMALTTSENDHEALGALRSANAVLKKHGITWDNVFRRTVQTAVEEAPQHDLAEVRDELGRRIDEAFETVTAGNPGGEFGAFIDSLQSQWLRNRSLSATQTEALFRAARRADRDSQPRFWR